MTKLLKLSLPILVLFMVSCGSDKGDTNLNDPIVFSAEGPNSQSVEKYEFTLLPDINELEQALALDQLLQYSPERSKGIMLSALRLARSGGLIIAKFGTTNPERLEDAFDTFGSALKQYESFGILDVEQSRFDDVFNQVRELRFLVGNKLGKKVQPWVLYNHNFADGVEPYFNMFPGEDSRGESVKWVTNFQTDIPKAKVQGREAHSWIVSKPYDLKNIESPSFRYFTQFMVVAPNPKDSLNDVINKVFQTYIILDQLPGEDPETIDASRKIKVDYKIDEIPKGRDFHDAWLPKVSLEKYKGHKVSIGFLFDTRQIENTQYYIWDIFDFEIIGLGVLAEPASIYAPNFGDNLGGFKSLSLKFGGEKWSRARDGLGVKAGRAESDAMILSPMYIVSEETTKFRYISLETFKKDGAEEATELLISTNFKGGVDPLDPSVTWEVLNSSTESFEKKQTVIDLKKYIGQSIVLAFRFKSKAGASSAWFIDKMYLETEGEGITEVTYSVPNPEDKFVLSSQDLVKINFREIQKIYESEETSPEWKKGSTSINISGFVKGGDPLIGKSQMIFPEVDLAGSTTNKLRINYALGFAKQEPAIKFHVRKSCVGVEACENTWVELIFPKKAFTSRFDDLVTSSWVDIPPEFDGAKVEIATTYKGSKGNTPGLKLRLIEVGGVR